MAEVDPRIMNHVRAQLHKDSGIEIAIPRQRRAIEDVITPVSLEQEETERRGVRGLLSRLALRATGPELSGD